MDRFESYDLTGEERVDCAYCGAYIYPEQALYNSAEEQYFCDNDCFYEWADRHADKVADFYYDRNIE